MNFVSQPGESHHPTRHSVQSTLLFRDLCDHSRRLWCGWGQNCSSQLPGRGWPPGWKLGYLSLTLCSVCYVIWINSFPFLYHCFLCPAFVFRKSECLAAKSAFSFVRLCTVVLSFYEEWGIPWPLGICWTPALHPLLLYQAGTSCSKHPAPALGHLAPSLARHIQHTGRAPSIDCLLPSDFFLLCTPLRLESNHVQINKNTGHGQ